VTRTPTPTTLSAAADTLTGREDMVTRVRTRFLFWLVEAEVASLMQATPSRLGQTSLVAALAEWVMRSEDGAPPWLPPKNIY